MVGIVIRIESVAGIVVMGVSGSGKSTLARALAAALGRPFIEGDDLHPPANIAKMAAAIPLTDADRWPFLANVAAAITGTPNPGVVVSCSALRRVYRDFIRARAGAVTFVLPMMQRATLEARLAKRSEHFMPAALLDSQLATLEMPSADEAAIVLDGAAPTELQVAQVLAAVERG
jgi:gluconokinase